MLFRSGLAEIEGATLKLRGLVASIDGTRVDREERSGAASDAETIGRDLGHALKAALPPEGR